MATDTCEGGYGVVSGEFAPSLVSSLLRKKAVHPTSDAHQSYMSRLSVAPSCSRPFITEAFEDMKMSLEDGSIRQRTLSRSSSALHVSPTRERRLGPNKIPLTMSSCTWFLHQSSDKPIRGSGGRTRIAADRTGETIGTEVLEQDGTGNDEEDTGDDGTTSEWVRRLTSRRELFWHRHASECTSKPRPLCRAGSRTTKITSPTSRDRSVHECFLSFCRTQSVTSDRKLA